MKEAKRECFCFYSPFYLRRPERIGAGFVFGGELAAPLNPVYPRKNTNELVIVIRQPDQAKQEDDQHRAQGLDIPAQDRQDRHANACERQDQVNLKCNEAGHAINFLHIAESRNLRQNYRQIVQYQSG
jgi:hypothetical protein